MGQLPPEYSSLTHSQQFSALTSIYGLPNFERFALYIKSSLGGSGGLVLERARHGETGMSRR